MVLEESELRNALQSYRDYRPTYYINRDRIKGYYDQCLGGIQQLGSSKNVGRQTSAEINLAIIKIAGSLSKGQANNVEWNLTHVIMAFLIEYYMEKKDLLLEISPDKNYDFNSDKLLRYIGISTFSLQVESPSTNLTRIPEPVCEHIQKERLQRLALLRKEPMRNDVSLYIWSAPNPILVSFCDSQWMDYGSLTSFGVSEGQPTGILGLYGQSLKFGIYDILLIAPLWIWKANTSDKYEN